MRTAVITVAAGRHAHQRRQHQGLAEGSELPHRYVVVAMGDPELANVISTRAPTPETVDLPTVGPRLPLAQARNLGARHALASGADLLIFLDVDCIPGPSLVARYRQVAMSRRHRYSLLCGSVAYLPAPIADGYPLTELGSLAGPHPARPAPAADEVVDDGDHTLFWSLSFAVTATTWRRIGGFCEEYAGYGGEDTDFGQLARQAGVGLCWVGGAMAFHQYHPIEDPPLGHLDDILRNATIFRDRWGWWPMGGWLTAFEQRGLIHHDPRLDRWLRTEDAHIGLRATSTRRWSGYSRDRTIRR